MQVGKQTALIAATVISKAHQSNMAGIKKSVDQVREMMRRILAVLANGRVNAKKLRDALNRRGSENRPSGPRASADEPRRDQEKRGPENPSQKDEGKKKQESTGQKSSVDASKQSEMVLHLSKSLDADGAMALWGLAVQEKGKFPDKIAEIAEGRLREIDPEMMKVFDESREQGKGRLEAMTDSLESHPKVGADFVEALKSMDEKAQGYKAELQEAKLVNAIEDLQTDQKLNGEPPLSSSEVKEHFQNNPNPTSGPYPDELLDKVTAEKYSPARAWITPGTSFALRSLRRRRTKKPKTTGTRKNNPAKRSKEKTGTREGVGTKKTRRRAKAGERGRGRERMAPITDPRENPSPRSPIRETTRGPTARRGATTKDKKAEVGEIYGGHPSPRSVSSPFSGSSHSGRLDPEKPPPPRPRFFSH
ncbi:hypothetical protein KGD82_27840 (plasmid) [Nocardiopsis eucommiae]|uniref:Uncharacterized protein n=1 Tax=Nocardiopsis eucommiae TaxID=2831970 RepID=A0A975LDX4_9ACTN|nr:hypothetical protein KGD82_27840 [Nocardiopsis eucommiae]